MDQPLIAACTSDSIRSVIVYDLSQNSMYYFGFIKDRFDSERNHYMKIFLMFLLTMECRHAIICLKGGPMVKNKTVYRFVPHHYT